MGKKSVRVYLTHDKENDRRTTYRETKDTDEDGNPFRILERKVWGSNTFEEVNGVYVSQDRYRELKEKIVDKTLTFKEFNEMRINNYSYDDIGGRFIRWYKLKNGNIRFVRSAEVEKVDPPFGEGGSSSYGVDV